MDLLEWVTSTASTLPVPLLWALGALFAFLENGLGLGFFVPGETIVVVLAAALSDPLSAVVMFAVVVVAGTAGDHVGYLLGRHFGTGLRDTKLIQRMGVDNWDRAVDVLRRRGAIAVFLTRLVPVIRTLTPATAGVARVRYPAFLFASLAGAATWAAVYVGAGYLLRSSLDAVRQSLGPVSSVLLIVALAAAVVFVVHRLVRKRVLARGADLSAESRAPRTPLSHRLFSEDEWRTWPNLITGIRMLLLPIFVWMITTRMLWGAIIVIGVVFLTDWLDGWLARKTKKVSALGTWLDPVADRITVFVTAGAFALGHLVPWETFVLLLIPDVLLGLAALLVFKGDPNVPVTIMGKIRTALIFVGLLGVLLGEALRGSVSDDLRWIVGLSFVLYLLGIIGHYIAASQYAKAMIAQTLAARDVTST
ncbi:VTT domain-containing protein [Leifsonia sp. ZF2019]|uniref:CDP-alcohol phosphatidyltransferase family protein n=1 Tax=Leifsonia sp. ZF2019 TaxID=2781978 RepID=UPI001CBFB1C4|nr:CDP-alcohol phosphatidyltransferase family protein [Leifsonia sp. ZF2019]UAJ80086.1 VTT domain-containing protein [Leifsonia sp. ZF2019]